MVDTYSVVVPEFSEPPLAGNEAGLIFRFADCFCQSVPSLEDFSYGLPRGALHSDPLS